MFKEDWVIYEVLSGSHAYGLSTPESDEDYRGIMIPPKIYFLSPFKNIEQYEDKEKDRTIYDIRKFINLASNNNPNILEILFIDEKYIKTITEEGKILRKNRNLFLSAKCKHTYSGYAFAQLKRIQSHKKWLLNPVLNKPNRSDFGLSDQDLPMSSSEYGVFNSLSNTKESISSEALEVFQKEKEYRTALNSYKQYNDWKKNRNPKRALLEEKYGFDLKHAKHLVRLMLQCKEILEKGTLTTDVSTNPEIKDISEGKWSFEHLLQWAETLDTELNDIYSNKEYVVPHTLDTTKIEEVLLDVLKSRI